MNESSDLITDMIMVLGIFLVLIGFASASAGASAGEKKATLIGELITIIGYILFIHPLMALGYMFFLHPLTITGYFLCYIFFFIHLRRDRNADKTP